MKLSLILIIGLIAVQSSYCNNIKNDSKAAVSSSIGSPAIKPRVIHKAKKPNDPDKPQGILLQLAATVMKAIALDNTYMIKLLNNGSPTYADADNVNNELIGILEMIEKDLATGSTPLQKDTKLHRNYRRSK